MTLHDQLMRAANEPEVVRLVELWGEDKNSSDKRSPEEFFLRCKKYLFYNIATEQVTCTTGTQPPAIDVLRVRPHQITHGAIMGHFLFTVNGANLVKGVDGRR